MKAFNLQDVPLLISADHRIQYHNTNTFSKTIPLAWEDPWKGLTHLEGRWAFL